MAVSEVNRAYHFWNLGRDNGFLVSYEDDQTHETMVAKVRLGFGSP